MRGAPALYQETPYFAAMLRAFASSASQERRLATRFFAGLEGKCLSEDERPRERVIARKNSFLRLNEL